ncbi:MAG: hypothetical protein M3Q29_15545 [Chloroflexota bacterium]|nr:hypothetical protein [Chloroflexota bacterium]
MHECLDLVELSAIPAKECVQNLREVVAVLLEQLRLLGRDAISAMPEGVEEERFTQVAREAELRPRDGGMPSPPALE